jgi:hypothetical protein
MLTPLLSLKLVLDVLFKLLSRLFKLTLKGLSLGGSTPSIRGGRRFFSCNMWDHLEGLAE